MRSFISYNYLYTKLYKVIHIITHFFINNYRQKNSSSDPSDYMTYTFFTIDFWCACKIVAADWFFAKGFLFSDDMTEIGPIFFLFSYTFGFISSFLHLSIFFVFYFSFYSSSGCVFKFLLFPPALRTDIFIRFDMDPRVVRTDDLILELVLTLDLILDFMIVVEASRLLFYLLDVWFKVTLNFFLSKNPKYILA